jgi:pyruvate/2-oxoglutarate/acetoin dehydrogenase E1 component
MLAHIPGLRVVIPSSPERAYGLLLAAIRDPDPAGLTSLLAPVVRVTGYDTVIPLPRLEQHYMPSVNRIAAAARKVCQFS